MSHLPTCIRLGAIAVVCAGLLTSVAEAAAPVITSASLSGNTLVILGSNLLGADNAGVYSITLGSVSLTVQSQSTTTIQAALPAGLPASAFPPGTYLLTVRFFGATPPTSATFQVAIGVVTRLMFQPIQVGGGYDTTIEVFNVSPEPSTASPGLEGSCSMYWLAENSTYVTGSGPIEPGKRWTFRFSTAISNFAGYAVARCTFKARGSATLFKDSIPFTVVPAKVNP